MTEQEATAKYFAASKAWQVKHDARLPEEDEWRAMQAAFDTLAKVYNEKHKEP